MASRTSIVRAARQFQSSSPFRACRAPRPFVAPRWQQLSRPFSASSMLKEKKYTEDHEWVEKSADGKSFTMGISTYAAKALGDVVYVELPEVGTQAGARDVVAAVESVKSASDIYTPLAGTVVEINDQLEAKPGFINEDPEGDAWIAKFEITEEGAGEEGDLMGTEDYKQFCEEAEG